MKRRSKEYSQFDRRYDELIVDVEKIEPYRDVLLSQDQVVMLLGRMAANFSINLQRVCRHQEREAPEGVLALQEVDPAELLPYYRMGRGISWGDADRIVEAWIDDGWEDVQRCVSIHEPSASEDSIYVPNSKR